MKKFLTVATLVAAASVATSASAAQFVYQGGLIKVGSRGTQVYNLQECLAKKGINATSNIDGIFGSKTKAAVMAFQASKNVAVDGIIGPVTGPLYTASCAMNNDSNDSNTSDVVVDNGEEGEIKNENVKIKSGDDKLASEAKGLELFEIEVEAEEDGSDVQIERMDLVFAVKTPASCSAGAVNAAGDACVEPNATFTAEVTEKNYKFINEVNVVDFAKSDTDSKNDWRSDKVTLRLNGEAVAKAGEEATFVVEIDTDELEEGQTVELSSVELRYVDEAGLSQLAKTTDAKKLTFSESDVAFALDSFKASDDQEEKMTVDVSSETDKTELAIYEVEVKEDVETGTLMSLEVEVTKTVAASCSDASLAATAADCVAPATFTAAAAAAIASEEDADKFAATVYAKVDGDTFEADFEDGKFVFDLGEMKAKEGDRFDVEIMADLAKVDEDDFVAGTTYQVTSVVLGGEDVEEDELTNTTNLTATGAATMLTLSQGDIEVDVKEVEKFEQATDNAGYLVFEVEVSNNSGDAISVAASDWTFDIEGVSALANTDTVLDNVEVMLDGAVATTLANEKTETYDVKVKFDAVSNKTLKVMVEEIAEISVIEA